MIILILNLQHQIEDLAKEGQFLKYADQFYENQLPKSIHQNYNRYIEHFQN